MSKGVQGERYSLPGKEPGSGKAKFEIRGGLKGKSLAMNQGLRVDGMKEASGDAIGLVGNRSVDELLSFELPQKKLQPHRSQPTQDAGQLEGANSIDAEHVERGGIVAQDQRSAVTRAPPQALAAKGQLPVRKCQTDVGIKHLELIDREADP